MRHIDLNADLGEEAGDDAALLDVVTTANVAAGGHAGGGAVLLETVRLAAARGVAVGAHPSYLDRDRFGRVSLAATTSPEELVTSLVEQITSVQHACAQFGVVMSHVKAHGALYNDVMLRPDLARALLDAADAAGAPAVMGLPGSALHRACESRGVTFIAEAFADRGYEPDGSLVPRTEAGAVIHDPDVVARRVLRLVADATVAARDGTVITVDAQSVCLHGDTPGAVAIAGAVRRLLEEHGVSVRPVRAP